LFITTFLRNYKKALIYKPPHQLSLSLLSLFFFLSLLLSLPDYSLSLPDLSRRRALEVAERRRPPRLRGDLIFPSQLSLARWLLGVADLATGRGGQATGDQAWAPATSSPSAAASSATESTPLRRRGDLQKREIKKKKKPNVLRKKKKKKKKCKISI
jgi:hypothetical protein